MPQIVHKRLPSGMVFFIVLQIFCELPQICTELIQRLRVIHAAHILVEHGLVLIPIVRDLSSELTQLVELLENPEGVVKAHQLDLSDL